MQLMNFGQFVMRKLECVWVLVLLLITTSDTRAQSSSSGDNLPRKIRLTGILKKLGAKDPSGIARIDFSLYQNEEGGSPLWAESQQIQLSANVEDDVVIGGITDLPEGLFESNKTLWLELRIDGEVQPSRTRLLGVPYAFRSLEADSVGGKSASDLVTVGQMEAAIEQLKAYQSGTSNRSRRLSPESSNPAEGLPAAIPNVNLESSPSSISVDNLSVNNLNSIRFAGRFANPQLAIDDAEKDGAVILTPSSVGQLSFTNPNNIPVFDMRGSSVGVFGRFGAAAYRGFYDVRDFGADCTGKTKNFDWIYDQFIYPAIPPGGATIHIPQNCQLTIADSRGISTGEKPIRFVGQGSTSIIAGTNGKIVTLASSSGSGLENLKIIDSNPAGNLKTIAVAITGKTATANWYILNCDIESNQLAKLGTGIETTFGLKGYIQGTLVQGWHVNLHLGSRGQEGRSNAVHITGSILRGSDVGIQVSRTPGADDLFLTGNTIEGNRIGLQILGGDVTAVANHFENDGLMSAGTKNVSLNYQGSYRSSGNVYSRSGKKGAIVMESSSTLNSYSNNDRFYSSGVRNSGTGTLVIRDAVDLDLPTDNGRYEILNGAGGKHRRVPSCTTAAKVGASCVTLLHWLTPFQDSKYTAVCSVDSSDRLALQSIAAKTKASISVTIASLADSAGKGILNCFALHD